MESAMRLWTLAFLAVATLVGLATRGDFGPLVLVGARVGFVMVVVLALLAGVRALAMQVTDRIPSACPRHARGPTPSAEHHGAAASRVRSGLDHRTVPSRGAQAAAQPRQENAG
jgi:hypothetical protein